MRRVLRRQHENGLGEVELAGDRLHRVGIEPFGVQDNGERDRTPVCEVQQCSAVAAPLFAGDTAIL